MIINHNITALNTHRQLSTNSAATSKNIEKLSSGLRINRAGDDAAGLAISEKMRGQIRGLDMASKNAQDGISLIQTAEGALSETHSILQRVRELSVQSANGTNTEEDRKALQSEVTQLKSEIDRIGDTTEFNTKKLLNGALKTSGASVGLDSTTGTTVGKQTAASLTGTAAMNSAALVATGDFVSEKIKIDGTEITVDWQNLSTEEQNIITAGTGTGATDTGMKAAADLIVSKINEAIDKSGANVAHISGYVSADTLVLESGSKGTASEIKTASATASIAGKFLAAAGATGATGASTYNGTDVASGDQFNFQIGDTKLQATLTGAIDNTTTMAAAATQLQTDINTAIAAANTAAGATKDGDFGFIKDVKVNALSDGRFEIVSESGPINLQDLAGQSTVKDLGLSQAQTDASGNGGVTFQIGANKGQSITFGVNDMRSAALGVAGVDISTTAGASNAITSLDKAISSVSSERAKLGAVQNRLEHTINNLNTSSENLTAAESRVRDVDMAKEMMEQTKNNILAQAAQAMLAQANQQPQGVLQLLR
ncbi:flagellin [Paenibacillus sp. FSL R5-0766]|uniref:flagellin N-terminal helical domain-containing protein n=1 Tax=unclassified Paenibacillus TaxID=185978 RepID=UPI00096E2C5C|nr:flagellin [Paenibacillus sp. FSL R5-0765]OMF66609.1 flagellin [Paenibacillus sp. FSL R5-0765]